MSEEETKVFRKLKEVFDNGLWEDIPNLKAQDRRKVSKEVILVDGLLHNLIHEGMTVTEVNRLLYTGSYVVADRLGLIGKDKRKTVKMKPWWQRRLERSIIEWRKDLGRVEEIRKGSQVNRWSGTGWRGGMVLWREGH